MNKKNQKIKKSSIFQWCIWFALIISIIYILIGIIKYPTIGIKVAEIEGDWVVTDVDKNDWAGLQNIKVGSRILAINGDKPGNHFSVKKFLAVEKINSMTISANNTSYSYENIKADHLYGGLFDLIFPSIFLLLIIAISIFVYLHSKVTRAANVMITFLLSIGACNFAMYGAAREDMFAYFLNVLMFLLIPGLFVHFLSNYFIDLKWFSENVYKIIYAFAFLLTFLEILAVFHIYQTPLLYYVIRFAFIIFFLYALWLVISGYVKYSHTRFALTLRYLIFAISFSFGPYIIFYLLPILFFQKSFVSIEWSVAFILILPLVFIYLISAERLFDIDFVIHRIRYYMFISIVPAIIATVVLSFVLDSDGNRLMLLNWFIGIQLLLIVFLYVKELIDFRIQHKLFPVKNNFQLSLHRISHDMKNKATVVELLKTIKREVISVIGVKTVHVYSKNYRSNMYCTYHPISSVIEMVEKRLNERTGEVGTIIELEQGFAVVLGYTTKKITVLWASSKSNRTKLNRDDLTYLRTIAFNTNIALENLQKIENLYEELQNIRKSDDNSKKYPSWISRLLINLSEQQRKQLSIDIHDTVLQEQLFLYRKLDDIVNRYQPKDEFKSELHQFNELLLDNIYLIRETCNELRPPLLIEVGIIESLKDLIDQFQLRSNFTVRFFVENEKSFQRELNSEFVLAIYRIVQELLTNAMKHSEADRVYLKLTLNNQHLKLTYEDNGVGLLLNKIKPSYSHMGLSGIEQRVNGLKGELTIQSNKGEGLHLEVTFQKLDVIKREGTD